MACLQGFAITPLQVFSATDSVSGNAPASWLVSQLLNEKAVAGQSLYNTVDFLKNNHMTHPIHSSSVREICTDMGCYIWAQSLNSVKICRVISRFQILRGKSPSISQKKGALSTEEGGIQYKCYIIFFQIGGGGGGGICPHSLKNLQGKLLIWGESPHPSL